ncbi:MAG TPA: ThiF family adenylyltransferase [Candidatus Paceibacterota bacterium]|nr:ThiF family adenylyltransferase [Candidatus Paceibacterota bacterium]
MIPLKFDFSKESFETFKDRVSPARIVDAFDDLLEDLFLIRNPRFKFVKDYANDLAAFKAEYTEQNKHSLGEWFYFPWNRTLAHYLPEHEHLELRTARNRNIITADEQQKLYGLRVAYAGLSVGSHGLFTFAHMGGGQRIKIADPDAVSPSNLNRIRFDFLAVGRKKCDLAREYIYQLDPYAQIDAYGEGVTPETIDSFLKDVDVLVEETDNLEMKIRLRLEARERGIPVIMATDNGDNVIFEAERFDLDRKAPLFNGAIGDITIDEFKSFPPTELPKLATKIAGPTFIVPRMMSSLLEVGKSIYSWPQLVDAATLSGVAIAYALKQLALDKPLVSSKCEINLDAILDPTYASGENEREAARHDFLAKIGL